MASGVLDLTTFSNVNIDGLHNNENLLKLLTICNFDREDISLPTEACDMLDDFIRSYEHLETGTDSPIRILPISFPQHITDSVLLDNMLMIHEILYGM